MGLSRTVFEINGDFHRKPQFFSTPVYFAPPLKRFPWELGIGERGHTARIMGLPRREKFDDIFIRLDTIHQRDRETDGRTDTGRQQRPRLRIASRGRNDRQ